ncbi:MAG: class I SAM-dependent methyltransferase [Acidimicrobiales bacterium]
MIPAQGASAPAAGWRDGYVVDVPYIEPITSELCPAWFSMACVLNGQPPIDRSRTLVWAELGSGSGLSACMVAAANDGVEVWGCDFNPAHVERARSLAAKAGLAHCTFDEASFEDVARDDRIGPTEVDVVVVHGVYSWVSSQNQQHIVEFIRRRLRPGGLAYISYEVPTGWASMVPIAEAMRLHTEADPRRLDLAFPEAVDAIHGLAEGGARYFPLGPHESTQLASLGHADVRYAVHEYLGSHFRPLMFDEVAEAMASARCSHIGSVNATDHLKSYWAPPALQAILAGTPDPQLSQMLQDLIVQRPLRRDLFRRGLAPSDALSQEGWLRALEVTGLGKEVRDGATVGVAVGSVTLDAAYYRPLVDLLAGAPLRIEDLIAHRSELTVPDAAATMSMLVGGSYAAPVAPRLPGGSSVASAGRLNRAFIHENRDGADHRSLIAPATGSAIGSEYVEMLALGAFWDGMEPDPAALSQQVLQTLAAQRRQIMDDGLLVPEPVEALTIIERRVRGGLERLRGLFASLAIR